MQSRFFALLMALTSCGPVTTPVPGPMPDLATAPDLHPAPSVCNLSVGTIDKNTPDKGYWASSGCAVDCLPPHQFFSICTTNAGVLLFDGTTEPQEYAATYEVSLPSNSCSATPWRIWQLEQVPVPADPGLWASPSIESDCAKYPKTTMAPLPTTGRFYYKAVAEVKQAVIQ